jgi:hypothetical protein
MYEHVNISTRLMVKKKFTALVMQEGKSTTSSMEKFQDLLNQMACVGLVVDDQEVVMQLLKALLPSDKTFVRIVGKMPILTLPILMAKLQEEEIMNENKQGSIQPTTFFSRGQTNNKPTNNKKHFAKNNQQ